MLKNIIGQQICTVYNVKSDNDSLRIHHHPHVITQSREPDTTRTSEIQSSLYERPVQVVPVHRLPPFTQQEEPRTKRRELHPKIYRINEPIFESMAEVHQPQHPHRSAPAVFVKLFTGSQFWGIISLAADIIITGARVVSAPVKHAPSISHDG